MIYTHAFRSDVFTGIIYCKYKVGRLKKGAVVTMLPYDFVDISNNQDEINEKKDRKYINSNSSYTTLAHNIFVTCSN